MNEPGALPCVAHNKVRHRNVVAPCSDPRPVPLGSAKSMSIIGAEAHSSTDVNNFRHQSEVPHHFAQQQVAVFYPAPQPQRSPSIRPGRALTGYASRRLLSDATSP